jgi:hypothetical protein
MHSQFLVVVEQVNQQLEELTRLGLLADLKQLLWLSDLFHESLPFTVLEIQAGSDHDLVQ